METSGECTADELFTRSVTLPSGPGILGCADGAIPLGRAGSSDRPRGPGLNIPLQQRSEAYAEKGVGQGTTLAVQHDSHGGRRGVVFRGFVEQEPAVGGHGIERPCKLAGLDDSLTARKSRRKQRNRYARLARIARPIDDVMDAATAIRPVFSCSLRSHRGVVPGR
jgi:hypothetical protein